VLALCSGKEGPLRKGRRGATAGLERGEEGRAGWFPVGGNDPLARCTHTTSSVDLRVRPAPSPASKASGAVQDAVLRAQGWALQVSADRMIAIDTPPLLSPSVLAALLRAQERNADAGVPAAVPAALQLELHALQLTVRVPTHRPHGPGAASPHATRWSCALTAEARHVTSRHCFWRRATWWW
jgi:hypothetical protein